MDYVYIFDVPALLLDRELQVFHCSIYFVKKYHIWILFFYDLIDLKLVISFIIRVDLSIMVEESLTSG